MTHDNATHIFLKQSNTEPPQRTGRSTLTTFPSSPDVIDTSGFRTQIPVLIAKLYAMFTIESVARGAISRVRTLAQNIRALHKAESLNFAALMIRALKADPVWQAQVRHDLGGETALIRWEQRFKKQQAPQSHAPDIALKVDRLSQDNRNRKTAPTNMRTDRDGLFRLAPLHTTTGAQNESKPHTGVAVARTAAMVLRTPKAIALTPQDLRPQSSPCAGSHNEKPLSRADIQNIWARIFTEHWHWNTAIMWADLALTIPSFRADIAPP